MDNSGEEPFDHIELSSDESALPDSARSAILAMSFERIEIGPLAGAPPRTFAVRLDGKRMRCADDASVPAWCETLFDYLAVHGVTPALLDCIRELGLKAESVPSLSRPSAPPGPAAAVAADAEVPKGFDVQSWTPEKGAPTADQLASIAATTLQKLVRAVVILLAVAAAVYQMFFESPEASRRRMERERLRERSGYYDQKREKEAKAAAQAKAIHDYW